MHLNRRAFLILTSCGLGLRSRRLWADPAPSHGFSPFGFLKYPAGFSHFDYVDPAAPKGGLLRLPSSIESAVAPFDSFNPFILRGNAAVGLGLVYESLMLQSADEPDSIYGLLADSIEVAADFSTASFHLNPQARFADGSPVTAEDVVFSHQILSTKGSPPYVQSLHSIEKVEALGGGMVRFSFRRPWRRTSPMAAAAMPILPAKAWTHKDFENPSFDKPLGSGPYVIDSFSEGRSVSYRRAPDYWGRDLNVNRGRYNFDQLRYDYYRDRDVEFEAFKAGAFDVREEFTSRLWVTGYTGPAVEKGLIKRDSLPDDSLSGLQAFFMNLRRPRFQDARVRRAIGLAFDFEWTNRTMFYGRYRRMESIFENSDLAAHKPLDGREMALLEPLRGKIPDGVFGPPFTAPKTDGSGNNREPLRQARDLLAAAGWTIHDGQLTNQAGEAFTIDYIDADGALGRVVEPFFQALARLGIKAKFRQIDQAAYRERLDSRDFDMVSVRFGALPPTPTDELVDLFGSASAKVDGSNNIAGIADPAVDQLIDEVLKADNRPDYTAACHALDRVIMHSDYFIPAWYNNAHNIAWWDRFGRPANPPHYALGIIDGWWYDDSRAAALTTTAPASEVPATGAPATGAPAPTP